MPVFLTFLNTNLKFGIGHTRTHKQLPAHHKASAHPCQKALRLKK